MINLHKASSNALPRFWRIRTLLSSFAAVCAVNFAAPASVVANSFGFVYLDYRGPANEVRDLSPNHWELSVGDEVGEDYFSGVSEPVVGAGLTSNPSVQGGSDSDDIWAYDASSVTENSAAAAISAEAFMTFSFTTAADAPSGMTIDAFQFLNVSVDFFGTSFTSVDVHVDLSDTSDFSNIIASDTASMVPFATEDTAAFIDLHSIVGTSITNNTQYFVRYAYFNVGDPDPSLRVMGDDFYITAVPELSHSVLIMALAVGCIALVRRRSERI